MQLNLFSVTKDIPNYFPVSPNATSWVGLGWNLNAGGAVIRNVKGIPDNGRPVPNLANLTFTSENYQTLYSQFKTHPHENASNDTAYDEFIVNAPGLSGTFYFVDNKAVFKDLQNTNVKFTDLLKTLEITKDDGTIYRFGLGFDSQDATEVVRQNNSTSNLPNYVTSWYLKEIIPPNCLHLRCR
ncbi:hypothetical protein [Flavobacterium gelatinilyticum]|uniref:hypothetical protein n=1 Tax=Flavobacterium gelatinilyticum TaxID=3003260 RepID=UPI0024818BF9|nr:hypothetical protein [Flavobacterium gelatinilyticum]